MSEPVHFHTDLYRRDALESAAEKYRHTLRVDLAESGAEVVARFEALAPGANLQTLLDEFCTEAFSTTAKRLRDAAGDEVAAKVSNEPAWGLLAPFGEGTALGLGWVLESVSPIAAGAASMALRHEQSGVARIAIRRNNGAPIGIAHTDQLDFLLMNGGGGQQ